MSASEPLQPQAAAYPSPSPAWVADEFAEFCRAEIASGFFHLNCRTVRTGSPSAGLFTNEDCALVTE
jgi:hypothetical protein